ncbi:DUF11 domain-containing protein, partial [Sinorhizobium meliloti]
MRKPVSLRVGAHRVAKHATGVAQPSSPCSEAVHYASRAASHRKIRAAVRHRRPFAILATLFFAGGAGLYGTAAHAQVQRSFLNTGFEEPALSPDGCFLFMDQSQVPGWRTTQGNNALGGSCTTPPVQPTGNAIELWRSNIGFAPREGFQSAELNAHDNSRLYQSVCLANGETIGWRLSHRGLQSATIPDVMELVVGSSPVARLGTTNSGVGAVYTQYQGTANLVGSANGWGDYAGSFTYSGATGITSIGFESISTSNGAAGNGNELDAIQIQLTPFVEFSSASGAGSEPDSANIPGLAVSGNIAAPLTIAVSVTGGTATLGSDYTTPSGTTSFNVTIPAGNYERQVFPLGVQILDNGGGETDETIEFALTANPASYTIASTTTCGSPFFTTTTHTIEGAEPAADLSITKDDGQSQYTPGGTVNYNIVVSNNGPSAVTGAQISDPLPSGISTATWTCGNALGGAACGAASGTGAISSTADLPPNSSVTYALSMTVPIGYSGDLTNTATVAAPAGLTDVDPSNNSATDTNSQFISPPNPPAGGACNLATNGSFEVPNIQTTPQGPGENTAYVNGYAIWRTSTAPIDGWQIVGGTVDRLRYYNNASEGAQSIDLFGTAPATVRQTFAGLIPGQQYTFSVDYSGLSTTRSIASVQVGNGAGLTPVTVATLRPVADAVSNGTAGIPNTPSYSVTWSTYTFTFTAAGTEATVQFVNSTTPDTTNTGLFIDDFAFFGNAPCEADLSITKDDGETTYTPGLDATYTITVTNNGPGPAGAAEIRDPLPAGVTAANWTCGNATGGAQCGAPSGTGAINTTANLPADSSVTYTLSLGVPTSQTGSFTNTATVTPPNGTSDPDTSNNTASDTNTMEPPPTSGACSPVRILGNTTFAFSPFGVSGTVQKSGAPNGWNPSNPWATYGGNFTLTWNFGQPVPINWIRFVTNDYGGTQYQTQTPPSVRITFGPGSTATPADLAKVEGDLAYAPSTGTLNYVRSGPLRQSAVMQGNSTRTVTSITLTATNLLDGDHIGNALYSRPACLTFSKVSEEGTGSFDFNMTNVVQASGTAVPSTTLTTTTAGTAVSSPAYNARPGTDLTLSEVAPAGWSLASAVCTDQNAGNTGNPTAIGSFASPMMTIPAANVRPESAIQCLFTNTPGEPQVSVKKELAGESITTNNVAEPGEVLTYRVTVTHESGSAFSDFEFIENIPNGATMTRVQGATGFTSPVAGASTVLLTVPEVPVGGEAVVEIDLTVAAPLPLGVTQIRNMVSGGDVPENCPECSVTTPTPPYTPAYPPTVSCSTTGAYFNTAYNGSGGRKTSGFDDYWQVALTPTPVNGAPPAGLTWGGATIVTNPPGVYIPSPFGNAGWISHNSSASHPDTTRNYDIFYRYQFNLDPAVEPSSLDLDMTFYSDNSVYQVWVNGQAQGIRSNYGGADPYFYAGFTAAGGATGSLNGSWRTGANEIIVHVKSGPGAQAFMAQINTPAICQPKVTLRKVVVNDNGGTAAAADFTLRATGQAPLTNMIEGAMGDAAVTNASIPSGTYALGEDNLAGYVADAYSCSVDGGAAAPAANNQLTLANGQNAICTVTNDDQDPQLTIEKTGTLNDLDGDGLIDLGETISYAFVVENTGNVSMTGVTVDDPLLTNAGISVTPGPQTLAPGGTATFTATYTPSQTDIDAGRVENTATGTGTPPSGPPVESPPDTVIVPPEQTPALTIEKTGTLNDSDGDGLLDPGETINFSFRVQNTGTLTMTGVTVNDPMLTNAGISVTPGPQTLAPGGTATFTATYAPTQAEIDAGEVENTATATGTPPSGPPTESPPDTVIV